MCPSRLDLDLAEEERGRHFSIAKWYPVGQGEPRLTYHQFIQKNHPEQMALLDLDKPEEPEEPEEPEGGANGNKPAGP